MATMPVPPADSSPDLIYHQAFIRAMNALDCDDLSARIHSAIVRAASATETSPAHLARLLASYGLRAPRAAFPDSFTAYVENYTRTLRDNPSLSMVQHHDLLELHEMWTQPAGMVSRDTGHSIVA